MFKIQAIFCMMVYYRYLFLTFYLFYLRSKCIIQYNIIKDHLYNIPIILCADKHIIGLIKRHNSCNIRTTIQFTLSVTFDSIILVLIFSLSVFGYFDILCVIKPVSYIVDRWTRIFQGGDGSNSMRYSRDPCTIDHINHVTKLIHYFPPIPPHP